MLGTLRRTALAAAAVVAFAPAVAAAQTTTFTTFAAWTAALNGGASGVDNFNDLPSPADNINNPIAPPLNRSAGAFAYRGTLSLPAGVSDGFYSAGSTAAGGDRWLSTNAARATMVFSNFGTGVNALGGAFFGSNIAGAFQAGNITIAWVTSLGSGSVTLTNPGVASFWGLVTTGTLTSVSVTAEQPAGASLWPTVNDLRLGTAITDTGVIPEPSTYALMATGLAGLAAIRRRRKA